MKELRIKKTSKFSELVGVFYTTIFTRDGFIIAKLEDGETVKGNINPAVPLFQDGCFRFIGKWIDDPKYGRQFQFDSYVKDSPHTRRGITSYLIQNTPGIGREKADAAFDAFGTKAVEVLENTPEEYVKKKLLTKDQAEKGSAILREASSIKRTVIDLLGLFAGRGFPKKIVDRCIAIYGARANDIVKENPYRLILDGIPGCGFKRVDQLYLELGKDPLDILRQVMCAWHSLRDGFDNSTWFSMEKATEAVRKSVSGAVISPKRAIFEGWQRGVFAVYSNGFLTERKDVHAAINSGSCMIADKKKADEESVMVNSIKRLLGATTIKWPTQTITGIDEHQNQGFAAASALPVGVLVGSPGTGKTYVIGEVYKAIARIYSSNMVAVCAPTGKAAVRITESLRNAGIRDVEATTIHRLLGVRPAVSLTSVNDVEFCYNEESPLRYDFIIVDEFSMCDVPLAARLFSACKVGTHILFVGDKNQLPPVGHGAPLRDIMKILPYGELTQIRRNSGDIVKSCARIKDGKNPILSKEPDLKSGKNLVFIKKSSPESSLEKIVALSRSFVGKDISEFQVICPLNSKSLVSRDSLNQHLQEVFNPKKRGDEGKKFRLHDKVICQKNGFYRKLWENPGGSGYVPATGSSPESTKEYVANGEIGAIIEVGEKTFVGQFYNPDRIIQIYAGFKKEDEEESGGSENFELAWAVTGHKMQGSEVKTAIIAVDSSPGANLVSSREWVYTAISRGKSVVYLVGSEQTLISQIGKTVIDSRQTLVVERFGTFLKDIHNDIGSQGMPVSDSRGHT